MPSQPASQFPLSSQHAQPGLSPAFIVGVGRSGTTLVASILNRHPALCVTSETHFFSALSHYPGGFTAITRDWPAGFRSFFDSLHHPYLLKLSPDEIVSGFRNPPTDAGVLFRKIGDLYAQRIGKRFWLEKTPLHLHHLQTIRTFYPDAKIIHCLRDGRDVALSLSAVGAWASTSYIQNLHRWAEELRLAEGDLGGIDGVHTVRYEHLITEPGPATQALCRFLDIPYHEGMLEPDGSEGNLIERGSTIKANVGKPVMTRNANKWRQLDPSLLESTHALYGDDLTKWGYEVPPPQVKKKWARVSTSLCLSNDVICDLAERPIQDDWMKEIGAHGLSPRLEDADFYSFLPDRNDGLWLLSLDFPHDAARSLGGRLRLMATILKKTWLVRQRVHFVLFVPDALKATERWPFRRFIEQRIARAATGIVLLEATADRHEVARQLQVPAEKIQFVRSCTHETIRRWLDPQR